MILWFSFWTKDTQVTREDYHNAETGRIVGGSVGTIAAAPLANVPVVGWVLAGAATMIGMNEGAEIGGNMAKDLSDACQVD